jgi:hypothetical protein
MNRRGIRIVAAQVVIVGALLLVVYLTLLQPEGQKPLFGVGVPSGPGQIAQAPGGGSSVSAGSAVAGGPAGGPAAATAPDTAPGRPAGGPTPRARTPGPRPRRQCCRFRRGTAVRAVSRLPRISTTTR